MSVLEKELYRILNPGDASPGFNRGVNDEGYEKANDLLKDPDKLLLLYKRVFIRVHNREIELLLARMSEGHSDDLPGLLDETEDDNFEQAKDL